MSQGKVPPFILRAEVVRVLTLAEDTIKDLEIGFPRPPISVYCEVLFDAEKVLQLAKGAKSQSSSSSSSSSSQKEASKSPGDWGLVLARLNKVRQAVEENYGQPKVAWGPVLKEAKGIKKAVNHLLSGLQTLRNLKGDDWQEAVRIADSEYRKLMEAVDKLPSPSLEERVQALLVEIEKMEAKT